MSDDEVKSWINSFDTVMTDCDGVLWVGSEPIQGSPQMINRSFILWIFLLTIYFYPHVCDRFRELGKRVFYVTNNSTKHRKEYKTKLDKLGFGGDMVMRLNFLTILSKLIVYFEIVRRKKLLEQLIWQLRILSRSISTKRSLFML